MAQTTQVRQIKIVVDTKGNRDLKAIADSLGGVTRSVNKAAGAMSLFKNAFIGFISLQGIRQLAGISDSMQQLGARIGALAGDSSKARGILEELRASADRSKTSIEDLATIYARLGAATKSTGISTGALISLTETLQKTFLISGASITEATSAAIQLSQGLASGQLRGQELRSVLEANVVIGDILGKTFNKTRGQLFKFAEEGRITANEVMLALLKNAGSVDKQAAQLGTTMEQSVTKSMNGLKLAIFDLNKELDISGKFATAIDTITKKFTLIATVVGVLALTQIPLLITKLTALSKAFLAFSLSNPVTAFLLAAGILVVALVSDFDELRKMILKVGIVFYQFIADFLDGTKSIRTAIGSVGGFFRIASDGAEIFYDSLSSNARKSASILRSSFKELENQTKRDSAAEQLAKRQKEIDDQIKKLAGSGGAVAKIPKVREVLAELNKAYLDGTVAAEEYYSKIIEFDIYRINRDFKEGRIDLENYNAQLLKISEVQLNRQFNANQLSVDAFQRSLEQVNLERLNNQLANGTINLLEYNRELNNLQNQFNFGRTITTGAQDYLEGIGTFASNVSDGIRNTFTTLENSFVDFIKNGKFNFRNFAQAILDDLARIIVRAAIIRPLAQGVLNFAGAGATFTGDANIGNIGTVAAKGAAFDNGVRKFAKGGIVSRPTLFGYGGGKTGLMGEAGTEAILPLSRGSGGDLGVKASVTPTIVNIYNQTGSEVETRESTGPNGERTLDILIQSKVKEGFASGAYDKTMRQAFGLTRKGS